jgi:hypothetical protein
MTTKVSPGFFAGQIESIRRQMNSQRVMLATTNQLGGTGPIGRIHAQPTVPSGKITYHSVTT